MYLLHGQFKHETIKQY